MTETPYFVKKESIKYVPGEAGRATIEWETPDADDASDSQVEYWAKNEPMKSTPREDQNTLVHYHSVDLTGLKPCSQYSFRVISRRPGKPDPSVGEGTFFQPPVPDFDWEGFFRPVDNPPAPNEVKAGSTVPVKFRLGGDRGLNIFAAGYPESAGTATAGSLSYDSREDQYTYLWRTDKAWSGSRVLLLKLGDCSEHRANFVFK